MWTAQLEAALLHEVARTYARANASVFDKALKTPVFALTDARAHLGMWRSATRTLELSRAMVVERAWPEVVAVLEHEMAHQYVDEVLRVTAESAHGETFQKVCRERGIDARAAGLPKLGGAPGLDKDLERIRKLLALAASANQHEAELAMKRAHELMLRHNLDRVKDRCDYEVRWVGDPGKRTTRVEADVIGVCMEFFFVEAIRVHTFAPKLGREGLVYELLGTPANLDTAVYVYEFLMATAERLWKANRSDARVKSGRDRLAYQAGVIRGFREKLRDERVELKSTGLVWVGDRGLASFYRQRHPHVVTRRRWARNTAAHAAGREAGARVVLHKPVTTSGGGGRGLLGSG